VHGNGGKMKNLVTIAIHQSAPFGHFKTAPLHIGKDYCCAVPQLKSSTNTPVTQGAKQMRAKKGAICATRQLGLPIPHILSDVGVHISNNANSARKAGYSLGNAEIMVTGPEEITSGYFMTRLWLSCMNR
jgi:hypothetical protein